LVFVDESGDHNMKGWDPYYPILVLVAVIISPQEYEKAKEMFDSLKKAYFGTSAVILHENDIRKRRREFSSLGKEKLQIFMQDIDEVIGALNFSVLAAIIDKRKLANKYALPKNPYHLVTLFILERIHMERGPSRAHIPVPVFFEKRGKKEDEELQSVIDSICSGSDLLSCVAIPNLDVRFVSKRSNEIGLQIADLIARPIGVSYLNPNKPNRAYNTIQTKLRRGQNGEVKGFGLKIFPE